MKKIIILLTLFFILGIFISPLLYAEKLEFVTYYPSPFGAYDRMQLVARDEITTCKIGTLYTLKPDRLMFCGEHGPIEITGLWVQSGNSLYPVLDTVNIGIGTQNPLSRLHLKGDATTQANLYVETGRIGIGVNPETSSYKLDVQGNTNIQGNANISGNAKIEGDAQVNTLTFSQGLDVGVLQVYYGGDNKFYANTQSFYAN